MDPDHVQIRTPEDKVFVARVLAEEGDRLVVEAPEHEGGRWQPLPGRALEVGLTSPGGLAWCACVVAEGGDGLEPVVALRLLSSPVAAERRAHPRVPVELDVDVYRPSGPEPTRGRCTDIGAGGIQAVVPLELAVGESVRLVIHAGEVGPLGVTARVVRRVGESRFGFVFELVVQGSKERLVRMAFERAARSAEPA